MEVKINAVRKVSVFELRIAFFLDLKQFKGLCNKSPGIRKKIYNEIRF